MPAPRSLTRQLRDFSTHLLNAGSLLKRRTSSIGLDIGSASIKGVKLTRTTKGLTLAEFSRVDVASDADSARRAQAIGQVLEALDPRDSRIVTAVGGSGAVLRFVLLPKMTPQELKTALSFEVERYIPFKLDESLLDFSIIEDQGGGRMKVLLAAAKTELVHSHLEFLKAAAVQVAAVDLEAVALANAWEASFIREESPKVTGLIHVGARSTILDLFLDSQLQFTREIPIGGEAFTQAVAKGLQMGPLQAETVKCHPGERLGQVQTAIQPSWEEWLSQCRLSFDFYEDQSGQKIERLNLSGGSARLCGFKEWIHLATGLPTEEWNLTSGLILEVDLKQLGLEQLCFGVAIGLAVREVS